MENYPKFVVRLFFAVFGAITSYIYLEQLDPNAEVGSSIWLQYYIIYPMIAIILFLLTIYFFVNFSLFLSMMFQFRKAKIRGLWQNGSLDKQIIKNFRKSEEIKIKLTRGHNTFCRENNNFHKIFSQSFINNISEEEGQRRIKVLLHFPCHHSKHLESRSEVNNIEESKYLKTIHSTIVKLNSINLENSQKILIKLKFHGDVNYRWRFFIFQKRLSKKVLFINHYESKRSGIKSPMLRVYNNGTLCDDFDNSYDEIYSEYACSVREIYELNLDSIRARLGCRKQFEKCEGCIADFRNKINDYHNKFTIT